MCFRLLTALAFPPTLASWAVDPVAPELQALAFAQGLDVRLGPPGPARYLEIAWGDCACSLYTGRRGRERVVGLVEALQDRGVEVQLLLGVDGQVAELEGEGSVDLVPMEVFRLQGLAALPVGRPVRLR